MKICTTIKRIVKFLLIFVLLGSIFISACNAVQLPSNISSNANSKNVLNYNDMPLISSLSTPKEIVGINDLNNITDLEFKNDVLAVRSNITPNSENYNVYSENIDTIVNDYNLDWKRCYGGSKLEDETADLQITSDNGFILAGRTQSNNGDVSGNHGDFDIWIVRLSNSGKIIWQKCYGGSGIEHAYYIQETKDHGFIFTGYSNSNNGDVSGNHGNLDLWIVRISNNGSIIWKKCYGGTGIDNGVRILETNDGGFLVIGHTNSNNGDVSGNHGDRDIWVLKVNKNGLLQWQKCLGGSGDDYPTDIIPTSDGNYLFSGFTTSNNGDISGNHGGYDFWVGKISNSGKLIWSKTYGGTQTDIAWDIEKIDNNDFFVSGYSASNHGDVSGNHGKYDTWIIKIDKNGNKKWQKCFGGSQNEEGYKIRPSSDGSFIVTGYTLSNDGDISGNHGSADYWAFIISPDGNILWRALFGGSGKDSPQLVHQTNDGSFIIAGFSHSNNDDVSGNHGEADYWILKIKPKYQIPTPTPTLTPTPTPTPSSSTLIAYYSFDGGTARDDSGKRKDGVLHGTKLTTGVKGNALSFNGKSDYISLPLLFTSNPKKITMMAWAKPKTDARAQKIIYNGNYETAISISNGQNNLNTGTKLSKDGSRNKWYTATTDIVMNQDWDHISGVFDTENHFVKLFLNGELVDQETLPVDTFYTPKDGRVRIGASDTSTFGIKEYFDGIIDEVRVYKGALTDSEIKTIYESYGYGPTPTPTPTGSPTPTVGPTQTPDPNPLDASFTASPLSGNAPLNVQFRDSSKGNPTSWSWNFGDGGTSIKQNPIHSYRKGGSYSIKLVVKREGKSSQKMMSQYITVTTKTSQNIQFVDSQPLMGMGNENKNLGIRGPEIQNQPINIINPPSISHFTINSNSF